jgi:hypothetical protein
VSISRRRFFENAAAGAGVVLSARKTLAQDQWNPNWISGKPNRAQAGGQTIALQPLAQQVRELENTFTFLGEPFSPTESTRINDSLNKSDETAIAELQAILDPHVLVDVTINAESRVHVTQGAAPAELVELGTRVFLVKIRNEAGVTAKLEVYSPNSQPVYVSAWRDESPEPKEKITVEDVRNRWAEISLYNEQPFTSKLSGLGLQYAILLIYSRDAGQLQARLSFDVGAGTQDIGFDKDIDIVFTAKPARTISLKVADDDGKPTMASFLVRDHLRRVYPNPAKRLAPDFFFQQQIYRADGESLRLPDGRYEVICTGGPEYVAETRQLEIRKSAPTEQFKLKRWIHPSALGWYPGDHHIHAAGCSHYVTPSEGVDPVVMMRQVEGEHLSVGCVLNWAPCYYHQKQFFTGQDDPLSKPSTILHYDLEISGFPSSHCGHLTLLSLKEQNYPNTKRIEEWPTWNLPILQWAKAQGAVVGYAHSGWGLAVKSNELPNYEMPAFDGIGANEFIVDVTHPNTVDFLSAGDTPYVWELNIWYHVLNSGFQPKISGETDFPCITDNRVGQGRVYAAVDGSLTYKNWIQSVQEGRSYVSDGKSHLMNFAVNKSRAVGLDAPGSVGVTVQAAAYLAPVLNTTITQTPYDKEPYWDIERARIGQSREVPVELVWNGHAIARQNIIADGTIRALSFRADIKESGWLALRILPSSHTNPIFVTVANRPMRPVHKSAEWCLQAVDQCWSQKALQISAHEIDGAKKAFAHARQAYGDALKRSKA